MIGKRGKENMPKLIVYIYASLWWYMLKAIDLYTSNGSVISYVNYISIKLFKIMHGEIRDQFCV